MQVFTPNVARLAIGSLLATWLLTSCGLFGGDPADQAAAPTDAPTSMSDLAEGGPSGASQDEERATATGESAPSPAAGTSDPVSSTADPSEPSQVESVDWESVVGGPRASVVTPWAGAPADDDALVGWLAQDRVPAFRARQAAAEARLAALIRYRQSTGSLSEALPELPTGALHDPALLAARLRVFDVRGERRARGQARPVPVASTAEQAERVDAAVADAVQALRAAHDAEAAADDAERGLLLASRAWLRESPFLTRAALDAARAPWRRSTDGTDPDDEPALADALRASEDLAAFERVLAAIRDTRLQGTSLGPTRDALLAELLEGPTSSGTPASWADLRPVDGRMLRIGWVREALPPREREPIDIALGAALPDRVQAFDEAIEAAPETERLPVAVATAELAAAEAHRDALPPALSPLGQARVDLADALLQHAEAPVLAAAADANATRRMADEARQQKDATAERTAALISARIPAEERVSALLAANEALLVVQEGARNKAAGVLADAREVQAGLDQPRLPEDLDAVYASLRGLVRTLRERARSADDAASASASARRAAVEVIAAERRRIASERAALGDLAEEQVQDARKAALDQWSAVLDEELTALDAREQAHLQARDSALTQLNDAVALRRTLAPYVSAEQRSLDNDSLFLEIVDEVSVVGPTYLATVRQRMGQVGEDPWWFLSIRVLRELALGSLWFIGAVAVWLIARRYADNVVNHALRQVSARARQVRMRELEPLRDPLRRLLVTTVDVIAAWMLFGMVPSGLPELAVVLLLIFEVQLLRLVLAAYDLLVGERASMRPALVRATAATRRLGRRSVLAIALWLSTFRVLDAFVQDVIAGFAASTLLAAVRLVALVILVVVLLYAWAPTVRARIARHPRQSPATRLLGAEPPTVLLGGPQALGGIIFLTTVLLRDLVFRIARQATVARWFSAVDRLRLGRVGGESTVEPPELPDVLAAALRADASDRAYVERPKSRDALVGAVASWRDRRRQGLIALLGDTGDGRGTSLRRWSSAWEDDELGTTWVAIEGRLATRRDAMVWLARVLSLAEVPDDVDDALAALEGNGGPGVIIVTGLHLSFLRTVGGFDALRTLLEVWHADPSHCWILCFYRPSWRYLERLGTAINIHLVQEVIDLSPLDGDGLREMTTKLAEDAGFTLDFQALISTGALAGDPEVERERAIESYYRLLAAASGGNPAVALDLWVRCLSPVEDMGPVRPGQEHDRPPRLAVHLAKDVRIMPIAHLGDDQLFVLAALRVQGELDEQELAEVLNIGRAQVRGIVRQLLSGGLLQRSERGVHVVRPMLPAVTLTLRRRHFLHWSPP